MEQKTEKRGGARLNAGRKPIKDKKKPVNLFIQESKIRKFGGVDKLKTKLYNFIN
jgi:hypothetical protein